MAFACMSMLLQEKESEGHLTLKIEDAQDSDATKRFQNAIDLRARS